MTVDKQKSLQEAAQLLETFKKEASAKQPNLANCDQLLAKLKDVLTNLSFLVPIPGQDPREHLVARETVELGALLSIKKKDVAAFESHIALCQTYYFDKAYNGIPKSERMYPLLGLNLLRLLSQNKIAQFHSQLELIDTEQIFSNVYIKYPVQLEQSLMEGSFNKVLKGKKDVPMDEYLFFVEILMETIRDQVASCAEKAYESLPLADATSLFYLKDSSELIKYAQSRGWKVEAVEKRIYFGATDASDTINRHLLTKQMLGYASELERII